MALTITEETVDDYERVVGFSDDDGFQCYIAIHNTTLGRALGGCRIKPYASKEDALADVLRLSKGMTFKSSLAGLNLGGGKCVVVADRSTREIILKVGEADNHLGGLYITAEDVGTTLPDIMTVGEVSPHIVHLDGSSNTALGVLSCIKAAVYYQGDWTSTGFGLTMPIWVQGLGKVGWDLFRRIVEEQPEWVRAPNLYVSDIRQEVVTDALGYNALEIAETDKRFMAVYAPCAMGQIVNASNVNDIRFPIICGSANNQLTDDSYAEILQKNGVLYCPDYLANAGGVITAAGELEGWSEEEVIDRCVGIGDTMEAVFEMADHEKITPLAAAHRLATDRL